MNFFEVVQTLGSNLWLYGGTFILILGILVFIHEWGHYIVARMCGVQVEAFSIGFGKEIFAFVDKNNTRWKIALIPLGGYVKLFGDVDPATVDVKDGEKPDILTEAEREGAFFTKSVWKRGAIVLAGPMINYLFAILILTCLFTFNGRPVTPPLAAAIIGGSSAEKYGFQPHDEVVNIDGKDIGSFEDIRREMMLALDEERHFVIKRGDKIVDIFAKPERIESKDRFGFVHSHGLLGLISPRHAIDIKSIIKINDTEYGADDFERVHEDITNRFGETFTIEVSKGEDSSDILLIHPLKEFNETFNNYEDSDKEILFISNMEGDAFIKYAPHIAVLKAVNESWDISCGTLEALGQMIAGTRSVTELGGIIRIGALAGDMARQGFIALVLFAALLSINLGLINLFPIPMLDGGHLLFYIFEIILGRPVSDQIQEYAFRAGLVFLVGIMAFTNLNDIMQLLL